MTLLTRNYIHIFQLNDVEVDLLSRVCHNLYTSVLAENNAEALRKELTDVRRLLADSNFEKEKYHNTNKDLRDHVKRTEGEKRELNRVLEESQQKITSKL